MLKEAELLQVELSEAREQQTASVSDALCFWAAHVVQSESGGRVSDEEALAVL